MQGENRDIQHEELGSRVHNTILYVRSCWRNPPEKTFPVLGVAALESSLIGVLGFVSNGERLKSHKKCSYILVQKPHHCSLGVLSRIRDLDNGKSSFVLMTTTELEDSREIRGFTQLFHGSLSVHREAL